MDRICIERLRALSRPLEPLPTHIEARGIRLNDIRCILFDVYGTLLISASGDVGTATAENQQQALEAALKSVGIDQTFPVEQWPKMIRRHQDTLRADGITFPEIDIVKVWRDLLRQAGVEGISDALCQRVAVEYEARVNPVWPMPGAWEVVDPLRKEGRLLGIVSNAQFYTPLLFEALGERTLEEMGFEKDLCVWSYQQLEAKPSTRLFRLALDALQQKGIAPECVLYVGNDMRNDIWPAWQLGCKTALFAGDQRSLRLREDDTRCNHIQPDIMLTEWSQLRQWL